MIPTPLGHNAAEHGLASGYNDHVRTEVKSRPASKNKCATCRAKTRAGEAKELISPIDNTVNRFIQAFNRAIPKGPAAVHAAISALENCPKPTSLWKKCGRVCWYIPLLGPALGHNDAQAAATKAVESGALVGVGTVIYAIEQVAPVSPSALGDFIAKAPVQFSDMCDRRSENITNRGVPEP